MAVLLRGLAWSRASSMAYWAFLSLARKVVPSTLMKQNTPYIIIGKGGFISAIRGANIDITLANKLQAPNTEAL